jgi:hypothetical protein
MPAGDSFARGIVSMVQYILVRHIDPSMWSVRPARKVAADKGLKMIADDTVLDGSAIGHVTARLIGLGLLETFEPWGKCRV